MRVVVADVGERVVQTVFELDVHSHAELLVALEPPLEIATIGGQVGLSGAG